MTVNNETSVTKKKAKQEWGENFEIDEKENVRKSHATVGWVDFSASEYVSKVHGI